MVTTFSRRYMMAQTGSMSPTIGLSLSSLSSDQSSSSSSSSDEPESTSAKSSGGPARTSQNSVKRPVSFFKLKIALDQINFRVEIGLHMPLQAHSDQSQSTANMQGRSAKKLRFFSINCHTTVCRRLQQICGVV